VQIHITPYCTHTCFYHLVWNPNQKRVDLSILLPDHLGEDYEPGLWKEGKCAVCRCVKITVLYVVLTYDYVNSKAHLTSQCGGCGCWMCLRCATGAADIIGAEKLGISTISPGWKTFWEEHKATCSQHCCVEMKKSMFAQTHKGVFTGYLSGEEYEEALERLNIARLSMTDEEYYNTPSPNRKVYPLGKRLSNTLGCVF